MPNWSSYQYSTGIKEKLKSAQRIEQIVIWAADILYKVMSPPRLNLIYLRTEKRRLCSKRNSYNNVALDITHKVLANKKRLNCIQSINNSASDALAGMLSFYGRYNSKKYGEDGAPLHDPTAIAWLIKPDLFTGKFCNVEIEVNSRLTRGATVIDWWGVTGRKENATVINDVDANGFFELLFERLENLG